MALLLLLHLVEKVLLMRFRLALLMVVVWHGIRRIVRNGRYIRVHHLRLAMHIVWRYGFRRSFHCLSISSFVICKFQPMDS